MLALLVACAVPHEDLRTRLEGQGIEVLELAKEGDLERWFGTRGEEFCHGIRRPWQTERRGCSSRPPLEVIEFCDAPGGLVELDWRCTTGADRAACRARADHAWKGRNWNRAEAPLARGCSLGDAEACFQLGSLRQGGKIWPLDPGAEERWFEAGCERGHGPSCTARAELEVNPCASEARSWVTRGVALGDARATWLTGRVAASCEPIALEVAEVAWREACGAHLGSACRDLAERLRPTDPAGLDAALAGACNAAPADAAACVEWGDRAWRRRIAGTGPEILQAWRTACLMGEDDRVCERSGRLQLEGGLGVVPDRVAGQAELELACAAGAASACLP